VALTTFDTATGAQLFTAVNMQPAAMLMTWRTWLSLPTAGTTAQPHTDVISVTRANGQVQDTRTFTAAALDQAILAAEATQTPQSIG
jgi:dihydrofolate reductase